MSFNGNLTKYSKDEYEERDFVENMTDIKVDMEDVSNRKEMMRELRRKLFIKDYIENSYPPVLKKWKSF